MNLQTTKSALRAQCLAARQSLSPAFAKQAAEQLCAPLCTLIGDAPRRVAIYRAIRGEIDVFPAAAQLAARGHTLCLPVIIAKDSPLIFKVWRPGDALQKSLYNVEIPLDSAPEAVPDLLIVPIAAFDRKGGRIGYGAGYYDRTIAALRKNQKPLHIIGAAYNVQCVEHIPTEPHDEKLHAIVTETESILVP